MGDVRAQRGAKAAPAGRRQHEPEIGDPVPIGSFGPGQRARKTEACRGVAVMTVNVAETRAVRREADGAVALAVEIMDHGRGEDDDKYDDHSLFHVFSIIPGSPAAVNRRNVIDVPLAQFISPAEF